MLTFDINTTEKKLLTVKFKQDMGTKQEKQVPRAMRLLEAGLSDLHAQTVRGDFKLIAKKAKVSERTVERYIRESKVLDFNIGKKILDIGRQIVIEREQSLNAA